MAPFYFIRLRGTPMCDCIPCAVFQTRSLEWAAHLENGTAGPFKERGIALEVATAEVLRVRQSGRPARLVAMSRDGTVQGVSCLCHRWVDEALIKMNLVVTATPSPFK